MERKEKVTLTQREQQRAHVLARLSAGQCSIDQAAQLLGLSVRHVWRLKSAYQRDGAAALAHGNRGKPSPTRSSDDDRQRIIALVEEGRYAHCNDSHLVELLAKREEIVIKREALRRILRAAGIASRRKRRAPRHRRRRDRMPQAGMLLQIDASPHLWLEDRGPTCALLGAIDDATGEVVAAVFRAAEDAQGYFLLLRQILQSKGIPDAIYRDRHSIFEREAKTPWSLEEELAGHPAPTQFGRALEEMGIASIPARSPQAKGRIERLWGTLQDRLVVELRLDEIASLEAANAYLPGFLTDFNARFAVGADDPGESYRPLDPAVDLERVLSFQYGRGVGNDNTVQFGGQIFKIPPGPGGRSYAKATVVVHELLDGSVGVWYNDRWLLRTPVPSVPPTLRARSKKRTPPSAAGKRAVHLPLMTVLDRARAAQPPRQHPWRRPRKGVQ
jgi:transposase